MATHPVLQTRRMNRGQSEAWLEADGKKQAMGGELEIRAIFPDGKVKIEQFSALAPSEEHLAQTASSSK